MNEAVQRYGKLCFGLTRHRRQKGVRKLPADRRAYLRDGLRVAEPVESRHQRSVQAGGDGERRRRDARHRTRRRAFAFGLQDRLRHLLDEQGNAVRALDDVLLDAGRQLLVSRNSVNQGFDVPARQPIYAEGRHVWTPDPRRRELRPERHEQ